MTRRKALQSIADLEAMMPPHDGPERRSIRERIRYRRNAAHRLDVINRTRVREGRPPIADLSETRLLVPV